MLTDDQKRDAVLVASVGCDRESVAKYIGCEECVLREETSRDAEFRAKLRRAEAACELAHMRNLQEAGRDVRQWRASVWWLERHAPDRYARREAGSIGRRELARFLKRVAEGLASAVRDSGDRDRVLSALGALSDEVSDPLRLAAPVVEEGPEAA